MFYVIIASISIQELLFYFGWRAREGQTTNRNEQFYSRKLSNVIGNANVKVIEYRVV